MKNFILDFETMGADIVKNDFAIIDCSFFVFDTEKMLSDTPYTTKTLANITRCKLSVRNQIDTYKWKVYQDTLDFWAKQSKEVQKLVSPQKDDLTLEQFMVELFSVLNSAGNINYWWSRSSSFDPVILWRIAKVLDKEQAINAHLPHYKQRDTRTFIDAKFDFPKVNSFIPIQDSEFWDKVFQEHNSKWDVLADVLRIQAILRAEKDLEMINR